MALMRAQALQRRLQVALGIDQEVGRDHHALAFHDAFANFDHIARALAHDHRARLEPPLGDLHQHQLPRATVEHRRSRDGQHRRGRGLGQGHIAKQTGAQDAVGVGQFDANPHGACLRVDDRLHERHLPFKSLPRQGGRLESGSLAHGHATGAGGGHVGDQPHLRQVGEPEDDFTGFEAGALHDHFFHHHRVGRRGDDQVAASLVVSDMGQLCVADIPVAQTGQGGIAQAAHRGGAAGVAGLKLAGGCVGDAVLVLRGDQFGAVDRQQRLATTDRHAGLVGVQPLDPALELRRDHVLPGLVDHHGRADAHARRQALQSNLLGAYAELLDLFRRKDHGPGFCRRFAAFVDGDVVHPHGILLRHRRGVGQAHRVAVVQQLARLLGSTR